MGYLRDYEHDIFVSYAHSEALNDWSKCLVEETRKFVAVGLGMRQARDVDLWMDYKICGNAPLTRQLRDKVERSGVLLVLMSEWYLESSWCRDEVQWFFNAVQQKRVDRPVFVVRVRKTDDSLWPDVFKDERGHPFAGYDFVRDNEDNSLGLPTGYPSPKDAPDSKEFYLAVGKLARDIVTQLRALTLAHERDQVRQPAGGSGLREVPTHRERIFLAATPAEDIDELREELAGLLRMRGCIVVPESNPLDVNQVHEQAPEWISNCDKFVQVLGNVSGAWRHDETGFVMYQHDLAKNKKKPIFAYRAPSLEISRVKKTAYRKFLESFDRDVGTLESFAARVVDSPFGAAEEHGPVYTLAGPRDKDLERDVRRLLEEMGFLVLPPAPSDVSLRGTARIDYFLEIVRHCLAIFLINSGVSEEDRRWIDDRMKDLDKAIGSKLGDRLPTVYGLVDEPRPTEGGVIWLSTKNPLLLKQQLGCLMTLSHPPAVFPP